MEEIHEKATTPKGSGLTSLLKAAGISPGQAQELTAKIEGEPRLFPGMETTPLRWPQSAPEFYLTALGCAADEQHLTAFREATGIDIEDTEEAEVHAVFCDWIAQKYFTDEKV